jgi:hypothetical protein
LGYWGNSVNVKFDYVVEGIGYKDGDEYLSIESKKVV